MIVILVEHFLTGEGKTYFPKWVDEVRNALEPFEGFRCINYLRPLDTPEKNLLKLEFDTLPQLRHWAGST